MLINKTELKQSIGKIQITKEFTNELEKQVKEIIQKSCKRARANNRTTLMERDL
jgi:histone H3/H4